MTLPKNVNTKHQRFYERNGPMFFNEGATHQKKHEHKTPKILWTSVPKKLWA